MQDLCIFVRSTIIQIRQSSDITSSIEYNYAGEISNPFLHNISELKPGCIKIKPLYENLCFHLYYIYFNPNRDINFPVNVRLNEQVLKTVWSRFQC